MKKIWICGADGMLGSHFKRLLAKRQTPFVANDYKEIDITQLEQVSDFVANQKVTHIINCAAYTQVDKAETEQKQAYTINALGPHHLGIAAKRHGARVIHFSTDYVFDGRANVPYTEENSCTPMGAYGMSKLAGEMKLLDEHSHSCVIRTSWLFGLPGKNFVETMLRLMNEKETLRIVSDQVGRPTYCQDLAEIAFQLMEDDGIYHFANAYETNWYKFAAEIYRQGRELRLIHKECEILPIPSHEYPTPAERPAYSTLSTKKIEQRLRQPPRPWQEALADYLESYKKYQETQSLN
ncbi:MAG: dTDP-4-dehydrorhamnose reductase [Parachlamydia sp.]|jgi:dTDP-4-dehydrorhamnose reductase|nr:dTDP-4-dehydrorhamnose reductase [Parachlamydia sp.]